MSLQLSDVRIFDIKDKKEIKTALLCLTECDSDFLGDNGEEYLQDEAKKAGYNNNADFYADKAINSLPDNYDDTDVSAVIRQYVYDWMEHDSYYIDYRVGTTYVSKNSLHVFLAYIDND